MTSKLRLYELAIERSWSSCLKRCNDDAIDKKLVESLAKLETEYLKESERVEIDLHLKFRSIMENLSLLFGSDIRKQLRDGWSFEVTRYLTACKERVLKSQTEWESQSKS